MYIITTRQPAAFGGRVIYWGSNRWMARKKDAQLFDDMNKACLKRDELQRITKLYQLQVQEIKK